MFEQLLDEAIKAIEERAEKPHCFSAHVPGQGYINDGDIPGLEDEYWRQALRAATQVRDNIFLAPHYSEPGYENPPRGILLANWNRFPSSLEKKLKEAGYEVEWSDEWMVCGDCVGAVRVEPDGMEWTPSYVITEDSELICNTCKSEEK